MVTTPHTHTHTHTLFSSFRVQRAEAGRQQSAGIRVIKPSVCFSALLVQQILRQYRNAGYLIRRLQAIRTVRLGSHYNITEKKFDSSVLNVTKIA